MSDAERDPIDLYFTTLKAVHELFGYQENWRVIPLDDHRGEYWLLTKGDPTPESLEGGTPAGSICYSEIPLTKETIEAGNEIYGASVYTQRFLNKWIYRAGKYVMVAMDTHTDGNKFLGIFDADKESVDPELRDAYREFWA